MSWIISRRKRLGDDSGTGAGAAKAVTARSAIEAHLDNENNIVDSPMSKILVDAALPFERDRDHWLSQPDVVVKKAERVTEAFPPPTGPAGYQRLYSYRLSFLIRRTGHELLGFSFIFLWPPTSEGLRLLFLKCFVSGPGQKPFCFSLPLRHRHGRGGAGRSAPICSPSRPSEWTSPIYSNRGAFSLC